MSYDTFFNLKWESETPTINEVARVLAMVKAGQPDGYLRGLAASQAMFEQEETWWTSILEGENETSWYEHQFDMARVSSLWPEVRFELRGHGEEHDDSWAEYYLAGKVQKAPAEIVYPEFDEESLANPTWIKAAEAPQTRAGFVHRGVLACYDPPRGYWVTPLSPGVRLGIKRREESSVVQLTLDDRDAVTNEIDFWLEEGEGFDTFEVTRSNAAEEARAQVDAAIRERIEALNPGVVYPEMQDRQEANILVAEAMQAMLEAFVQGEAPPAVD